MKIYHVTDQTTWQKAINKGKYEGDTYTQEGFIHCCLPNQLDFVISTWFAERADVIILEIETEYLIAELKMENLEGGEPLFPHVYGIINLDAIVAQYPIELKDQIMNNELKKIDINRLQSRIYDLWNSDWLLLTCGDFQKNHFNSMTVAWGGFGNMWNLPIAMVVVRPTRYTFEFINAYETFTLCGFPPEFKRALSLLGNKSGRDGDKILESGLTVKPSQRVEAPSFSEANLVLECKKIYWEDFNPQHFLDPRIEEMYPEQDYHRMVLGEIIFVKGDAGLFES